MRGWTVRRSKMWVSILILVIVGLHALPVLSYQGSRQTRWPFLAWAMYAQSYPPGPVQAKKRRLIGTTAKGADVALTHQVVGLSGPAFGTTYIAPIYRGDTSVARELLARVNRGRSDSIIRLRTSGEVYTVTDTGLRTDSLPVLTFQVAPTPSK